MKKILLSFVLFIPFLLSAQLTMDDFDSYTTGDFDSQWNAANWVGWFGNPSGSVISDEQANSGTNSVKIETNNDLVALLGTLDNGTYEITFQQYIPTGFGAYLNMQHNYTNSAGDWAAELYFGNDVLGTATIAAGGAVTPFNVSHDEWVENRFVFNFNSDLAEYYYKGILVATWPVSTIPNGGPGLNQINAINFFGTCLNDGSGCESSAYYDDILITFIPPPPFEVAISSFAPPSEYTNVPLPHVQPFNLEAEVSNQGGEQVTSLEVTANIYDSNNALVYSESIGSAATLDPGASVTFNTPPTAFTPSLIDAYTVEYIAAINEMDGDESNNIGQTFAYTVTDSIYARDDGNYTDGLGTNNQSSLLGQTFNLIVDADVKGIQMSFGGGATGDTILGHIYTLNNGVPDLLSYTTEPFVIDTTGAIGSEVYVDLLFAEMAPLFAGNYAFIVEQRGNTNLLTSTTPNIFTLGTTVASLDGGTNWDDLGALGFALSLNIRPILGPIMVATEEPAFAADVSIAPNPTSDETILSLSLSENHDLQLDLFNIQGQLLYSKADKNVSGYLQYPLSLRHLPDGMYFIRINVDGEMVSRKINLVK